MWEVIVDDGGTLEVHPFASREAAEQYLSYIIESCPDSYIYDGSVNL